MAAFNEYLSITEEEELREKEEELFDKFFVGNNLSIDLYFKYKEEFIEECVSDFKKNPKDALYNMRAMARLLTDLRPGYWIRGGSYNDEVPANVPLEQVGRALFKAEKNSKYRLDSAQNYLKTIGEEVTYEGCVNAMTIARLLCTYFLTEEEREEFKQGYKEAKKAQEEQNKNIDTLKNDQKRTGR